jgi:hypothetical protein
MTPGTLLRSGAIFPAHSDEYFKSPYRALYSVLARAVSQSGERVSALAVLDPALGKTYSWSLWNAAALKIKIGIGEGHVSLATQCVCVQCGPKAAPA